jgi:antitoxin component HigA of HigAB toxin-antitoxin module
MATLTKMPRNKDTYLDLILNVHPLRPIETSGQHEQAKRALRGLANDKRLVAVKFKKVLAGIIEAYERETHLKFDVSDLSPADIVRHLLAERGMSVNAFAKDQGISQSALSEMLNGKRDWSKSVIVAIADYFGLNRGLFLR